MANELPVRDEQITVDGQLVTVIDAVATDRGADLVVRGSKGLLDISLTSSELVAARIPANDAGGHPARALAGLWGRWMQFAVPRIRSAVLATRPDRKSVV